MWAFKTYQSDSVNQTVDSVVPGGVEVAGSVFFGQFEVIASSVTFWEFVVDTRSSVKRLVYVTSVVDDQSQGSRQSLILLLVAVVHNLLVDVGILVISFLFEPVSQNSKGFRHVVSISSEIKIRQAASLIQIRSVNEVPRRLVASTHGFDLVSKDRALDKWVLVLEFCL